MRKFLAPIVATAGAAALVLVAAGPAIAAVQNDLLVYNKSATLGTADGFVGKGAVNNGAEVWTQVKTTFEWTCTTPADETKKNSKEKVSKEKAKINDKKEITVVDRLNKRNKTNGYTWAASGLRPLDESAVCDEGEIASAVTRTDSAKVFLQDAVTEEQLLDTTFPAPIEVILW